MFAARVGGTVAVCGDLLLDLHARVVTDQVGLFMGAGFDFVGGALSEQQRVLQRLFHRFEVADALAQIGGFCFERGALLRLVFERLDQFVEKLIDVRRVVAVEFLLERFVLDVDDRDLCHVTLDSS